MITIEEQLSVKSSIPRVWSVLSDPRAVVDCIPGAALTELGDDSFSGTVAVRFGPMRALFSGRGTYAFDEDAKEGNLTARGKDSRGGTKFSASVTFRLEDDVPSNGSQVLICGEMDISGSLVSVIDSGISSVVQEMTAEFAERLKVRCQATDSQVPESSDAISSLPNGSGAISLSVFLRGLLAAWWRPIAVRLRFRAR